MIGLAIVWTQVVIPPTESGRGRGRGRGRGGGRGHGQDLEPATPADGAPIGTAKAKGKGKAKAKATPKAATPKAAPAAAASVPDPDGVVGPSEPPAPVQRSKSAPENASQAKEMTGEEAEARQAKESGVAHAGSNELLLPVFAVLCRPSRTTSRTAGPLPNPEGSRTAPWW